MTMDQNPPERASAASTRPYAQLPSPQISALAVLVFCGLVGAASVVVGGAVPLAGAGVLLGVLAIALVQRWVGVGGLLVLAPALIAFSLMTRFDEALAVPLGVYWIKATYWSTCIFVVLLAAYVSLYPKAASDAACRTDVLRHFPARFTRVLLAFGAVGVFSTVLNARFDTHVPGRSVFGELLGLAAVCVPMAFACLLPCSPLTKRQTIRVVRVMILLGAAAGVLMGLFALVPDQVLAALGWPKAISGTLDLVRGRLPLGHPNTVAAVLLALLPASIILGLRCNGMLWRIFCLASATLMLTGILFSLSRAALAIAALALATTLAYCIFASQRHRFSGIVLCAALVVMLSGITAALFSAYDFSRFWSRQYSDNASVERRVDSLMTGLTVWRDHPVYGVGPNSAYPRFEILYNWIPLGEDQVSAVVFYKGRTTAANPHNVYLQALAEYGIIGAGLFFWLLLLVVRGIMLARRQPGVTQRDKDVLTGLGLGVAAFLLSGVSESHLLYDIRSSVVFWVFAGLAVRYAAIVMQETAGDA